MVLTECPKVEATTKEHPERKEIHLPMIDFRFETFEEYKEVMMKYIELAEPLIK